MSQPPGEGVGSPPVPDLLDGAVADPVTGRVAVAALDAADPLAGFRSQFRITDPGLCYLDGNSLGRVPEQTRALVRQLIDEEWGTALVQGWADWIDEAIRTGDLLGRAVLGAGPGQVLATDTTSVNLYRLAAAALDSSPGRRQVIVDAANFPTDRYVLEGLCAERGRQLVILGNDGTPGGSPSTDSDAVRVVPIDSTEELITPAALAPLLGPDTALVSLQVVQYRSGARQDVPGLTALVHSHGAHLLWDAAHAAGSVPLHLDEWGVRLAVGCTYKYLNAGPGAPAWLYVSRDVQEDLHPPIQGWFGQADQFGMGPRFQRAPGIRGFAVASPSIMGLRCVQAGAGMIEEATMAACAVKVERGTALMVALADAWLAPLGFTVGTPRDPGQRGGHICLHHRQAAQISIALRRFAGVIADFRQPDVIRVAISPLATSYTEVWEGFARLRDLVAAGEHEQVELEPGVVT